MNRTAAIAELPDAYAIALRARDEDLSNAEIAARVNVDIEAVEPLLRIAAAKLGAILADRAWSPQRPEDDRDLE
jgi:DNA-directed RNA polymerase specialized sigma24 family protein